MSSLTAAVHLHCLKCGVGKNLCYAQFDNCARVIIYSVDFSENKFQNIALDLVFKLTSGLHVLNCN